MSAGVDVLAVMNALTHMPSVVINLDGDQIIRPAIINTRDAVAELIEAISAFKGKRGAFMALGAQDKRTLRLWAALARLEGAK